MLVGAACTIAALAGLAGLWWWWGVGFEEADAYGMATTSTDNKMVASFWIAVVGLLGAVVTGVLALRDWGRRPGSVAWPD